MLECPAYVEKKMVKTLIITVEEESDLLNKLISTVFV